MIGQDEMDSREMISALADGQLRGEEFARAVASLSESDEGISAWHTYHVVGDVLRCSDLSNCSGDQAFVARLRGRLSASLGTRPVSVTLAPGDSDLEVLQPAALEVVKHDGPLAAANDPVTRWKLLAGLASIAAVAAIGWQLIGADVGQGRSAQLASVAGSAASEGASATQSGTVNTVEPQVMVRDPRLDELLAAHKQFGGTSALQMPAGFMRNATFEGYGR